MATSPKSVSKLPSTPTTKLTKLPGTQHAWIDCSTITCVRIESGEHGSYVVIHTTEGYAIGATPDADVTPSDLARQILALIP